MDEEIVQLHVFTDASKCGYAAVIYARVLSNELKISFVQARTRLAPSKPLTIPRLELMGCWLGAQLLKSTLSSFTSSVQSVHFWTDSTTALAWIKNGNDWSIFVRNRVQEIRQCSDQDQWRFVPGKINPADLPSRGCSPSQLASSRWWEGPGWLLKEDDCPANKYTPDESLVNEELQAKKRSFALSNHGSKVDTWYLPTSSFKKNVRILAYVRRFGKRQKPSTKSVTQDEFTEAENWIFRQVQIECFDVTA